MNRSDLNKPADFGIIRKLYNEGYLSDDAFTEARNIVRPASLWFSWAGKMLLFYGSALVLAGIIYFFAYNWAKMGRFVKFGIIETGIISCVIASYMRGITQLSGKTLLLAASVLVGVLLAVYGQIYQTGADAFELFTAWAALIACWVIISDFAALWMVWLLIINTGAVFFWTQVGDPTVCIRFDVFCIGLATLNGTALVLREAGVHRGFDWLSGRWHRWILLSATLVILSIPVIHLIVDSKPGEEISGMFPYIWLLFAACSFAYYRLKGRDMTSLSLVMTNACVLLLTWIGNMLFSNMNTIWRTHDGGPFLIFALIILAVVSAAAFFLKKTAAAMEKDVKEPA